MRAAAALAALAVAAFAAPSAHAQEAFEIKLEQAVPVAPERAYRGFVAVQRWWRDAHTYSGRASALRLEPRPGGCWCERLGEGGFVEHMRVIYAAPGETLRLSGGLGPLQQMPVSAVMTATFAADSAGAKVALTYTVAGPGVAALEGPVRGVLAEALASYAASVAAP